MTKLETKLADVMRANKPLPSYQGFTYGHGLDQGRIDHWETLLEALAEMLAGSNPRFNRALWLAYVNGECTANAPASHLVAEDRAEYAPSIRKGRK